MTYIRYLYKLIDENPKISRLCYEEQTTYIHAARERPNEGKRIALLRNLLCIPLFYGNFLSCMLIYHYCSSCKIHNQHTKPNERESMKHFLRDQLHFHSIYEPNTGAFPSHLSKLWQYTTYNTHAYKFAENS